MKTLPVVPICDKQKLDISDSNLINDGLYRICNVAIAGGGYDKLPKKIVETGIREDAYKYNKQFVVQLKGCPFKCKYCYVTPEGINGSAKNISIIDIITDFYGSNTRVFHLMGGAPALYLDYWPDIINRLLSRVHVFHSDFILLEAKYSVKQLMKIATSNSIYAVSVKAIRPKEYKERIGIEYTDKMDKLFWDNLYLIVNSDINYYITFTGMKWWEKILFWYKYITKLKHSPLKDFKKSYSIKINNYLAIQTKL